MENHLEALLKSCEEYKIPLHGVRLPTFEIEDKYKKQYSLKEGGTNFDFLKALCNAGFKNLKLKKSDPNYDKYVERVKYELKTVESLGFVDYFLLVWYVIDYCKKEGIPTGAGRGSGSSSLILYLIGVTRIDPLKYGLIFERFISETRAKKQIINGVTYLDGSLMCDVDLDICFYRRQELLNHLAEKFKGKTSKISTFNTFSSRSLIKMCGKTMDNKTENEMNYVSGLIPQVFDKVKDLEVAYAEVEEFRKWCDENKTIYNTALKLRNLNKNKGVHPSGIAISFNEIIDDCPLELSSDKHLISTFDMSWVSLINVKLDCLGLRSVSVVDDVCKQLKIEAKDIDIDNPFIYQQLFDLRYPHGIFQIEAETNFKVCQKVKPKNFTELYAILGIARPGALAFADQYANFTNNGIINIDTGSKKLDEILTETGGALIFQETILKIAHEVFGLSLLDAENIRRAVSKKKHEEMEKYEHVIKDQAKKLNIERAGEFYWKCLIDSADYLFVKSHAASYANLSAITVYLKFSHPKEFFLSLLRMTKNEGDPITEIGIIEKELQYFNIKLLPPDLRKSGVEFQIEGDNIRFGLSSIKGISDKVIERMSNLKHEFNNRIDIFQSAKECGINIGAMSALVQAGALEEAKQDRSKCVLEAQLWNILSDKEKKYGNLIAEEQNYSVFNIIRRLKTFTDDKGKPIIKESRFKTILDHYQPYKAIYVQNSANKDFCNYFYESKIIGYSFSSTLKQIFDRKTADLVTINEVKEYGEKTPCKFVAIINEVRSGVSKNKNPYCKIKVSDNTGSMYVIFTDSQHSHTIEECRNLNKGKLPKEGDIAIIEGKTSADIVFANLVAIQTSKIYTKWAELKRDKLEKEA
mgnify:CR=1 FL=1